MLTDMDMFLAAQQHLTAHLAMRPITCEEAGLIAADFDARAAKAMAESEVSTGLLARNKYELSESYAQRAKLYREIASRPEGKDYEETTKHLEARVAFYAERAKPVQTGRAVTIKYQSDKCKFDQGNAPFRDALGYIVVFGNHKILNSVSVTVFDNGSIEGEYYSNGVLKYRQVATFSKKKNMYSFKIVWG